MTTYLTTPAKARAYYRMASVAHAKGDHRLGNHWADRGRAVEAAREARVNARVEAVINERLDDDADATVDQWHDDNLAPND